MVVQKKLVPILGVQKQLDLLVGTVKHHLVHTVLGEGGAHVCIVLLGARLNSHFNVVTACASDKERKQRKFHQAFNMLKL